MTDTESDPAIVDAHDDFLSSDIGSVHKLFLGLAAAGLGAAGLYAVAHRTQEPGLWQSLGGATIIAGAMALAGGFIGFLFAIPRSRQGQDGGSRSQTDPSDPRRNSDYSANTNLEQISDWLTKILVGVTLVQFQNISAEAGKAATILAPLLGGSAAARPMTIALMTFFSIWGFFFAYLIARLWLPRALSKAERAEEASKRRIESAAQLGDLESKAYWALYEPPPLGYTKTIDLVQGYLAEPNATPSGSLLMYLAAAYGQKHAYLLQTQPPDGAALADTERQAMAAVERALALNPGTKPILTQLYQGKDPNENDLVTLRPNLDGLLG